MHSTHALCTKPIEGSMSLGASQYPSVLPPMTRKPIELSHLEGHLNSPIAP